MRDAAFDLLLPSPESEVAPGSSGCEYWEGRIELENGGDGGVGAGWERGCCVLSGVFALTYILK